jgi:hypothetical protein
MDFSLQSCPIADFRTPLWLQLSNLDLDPTATESQSVHLSVRLNLGAWELHSTKVGKNVSHEGVCLLLILSTGLAILDR